MASLQRARTLAAGGVRAVVSGDPAARRRVLQPLRARLRPTRLGDVDPLLAAYARAGEQIGVDDVVATGLRTKGALLRDVAGLLAERTGSPSWRAGHAELLLVGDDGQDVRAGVDVVSRLVADGAADQLTGRQALLYAHALLRGMRGAAEPGPLVVAGPGEQQLRRELALLTTLSADERADIETDLAHPDLGGDEATWWSGVTRRWREAGMLVPRLLDDDELTDVVGAEAVAAFEELPVLDRVGPDPAELAVLREGLPARVREAGGDPADLPLVSVVVTAYRPGPWLTTAMRALLDQTWPQVEVVVVDDASGPEHAETIARAAALHPRARVVTRESNGGAYRARNDGVAAATGEYVAFLDADDWIHPERVERALLPLLADPDLPMTRSLALRGDDRLHLAWPGYPAVRHNAAGPMLRRSTLTLVGPFDEVRKSADSEYDARVVAVTGVEPPTVEPALQLTRLRPGSLSRADFGVGWGVGGRLAYRSAYKAWHRTLPKGEPVTLGERAPFAAPRAWTSDAPHPRVDVLVVDDAADTMVDPASLAADLEALAASGLRVALLHRENPARMRLYRKGLQAAVRRLVDAGTVTQVHPEEAVEAVVVWVRTPEVAVAGRPAPLVSAGAVLVGEPDGAHTHRVTLAWTRAAVEDELATWGVPAPRWVPAAAARDEVAVQVRPRT